MSDCTNIRPIEGCFKPNDGSDSVPVIIHVIYDMDEIAVGQSYTLGSNTETPLDPATYLGGGVVTVGSCDISTVVKKACVGGFNVDVLIGTDNTGEYVWFKNMATGALIPEPDFTSTCPELTCETSTTTVCADGNYSGINDGDAIILVLQNCSDGSSNITGATLLTNPTVSLLPLPSGILFKDCNNAIETELIGCIVDEDGVKWNVILIDGATTAYQNQADNSFGTPNGDTQECKDASTVVSALSGKHCIEVDGNVLQAFLFLNEDKTICAKEVGGDVLYAEGDYILVSCCPNERTETTHLSGFTVARPSDTPNNGWANELTNGTPAISGDFDLCFTPTAQSGNTPQMIGMSLNPSANTSYTSIDSALYLYSANGLYRIYHYVNGSQQGLLSSANWVGSEICFSRAGGVLSIKLNGVVIASTNIGVADLFLDDSHYYDAGFWGSGSITYSDFNLVAFDGGGSIKSVEDCLATVEDEITYTTGLDTEILNSATVTPTFPLNTKEVNVYNNSRATITIDTNIGAQTLPPRGSISFEVFDYENGITATSMALVSGNFGANNTVIFNYKTTV